MEELHLISNGTLADADQVMENFNELDRRSAIAQLFAPADPQPVGLYFAYSAGRIRQADGDVVEVVDGQVLLDSASTNYVEVDSAGAVTANTTGFTESKKPIAEVVTLIGSKDTIADRRVGFDFSAGGGGSSINWQGEWAAATSYAEGDVVQNGDPASSYRAKTTHTSGASTQPGVGVEWEGTWEIIAQAGENGLAGGSLDWKGDWANATAYDADDAVQDGTRKSSYRCKSAHTSGSTTRPGLGASWTTYWTLIAQAGEAGAAGAAGTTGATGAAGEDGLNGVVWQGAWNSVSAYTENDAVSHNGSSYVCTTGNTNQEPPNGTYWDLLAAEGDVGPEGPAGGGLEWLGDWETAAGYAVNDAVQNGSPKSSYRCHTAHTAATDNEPGVGMDWEDFWILVAGAGGSAVESLDDLDDVVITSPLNNQVLKHNGTNWVNGAAPSAGHIIANEGVTLTARATLDFVGQGVTATDDGTKTIVTIPGPAAGLGVAGIVEAHLTGTQSISHNTATAIQFSATDTDPADYWDSGTPTKFVVPAGYAGRHDIKALVEFPTNSTGNRSIAIYKNGVDITGLLRYAAAPSNDTNIGISWTADLEEGDEVEIYVAQTSGGALNIQPKTAVSITRLAVVDEINALQIQGRNVAATAPTDGQVLAWNNTASEYQPVDQTGGGGSLTPNKFKTLSFVNTPGAMEFGIEIGAGTNLVVLNGAMSATAIKAAIEASADFTGYTATVFGSTLISAAPDNGLQYTGKFVVSVDGTEPLPTWGAVTNAEVQSLVVEDGDSPGDDYYQVVGAGTVAAIGDYYENGTLNGYPKYDNSTDPDFQIVWSSGLGYWVMRQASIFSILYAGGGNTSNPADGVWTTETGGSNPAPTVTQLENGQYTLNSGDPFSMGVAKADLQNNQRALGGDYANVTIEGVSAGNDADFVSYFPYAVGGVSDPTTTGTNAVASTVYEFGSASSFITIADTAMDDFLSANTAYSPANPADWESPLPSTTHEALDRLSALLAVLSSAPVP